MKRIIILFLILLFSQDCISQDKLKINIKTNQYLGDSIFFGVPEGVPKGFEDLFNFKLTNNSSVHDASIEIGYSYSVYKIKLKENLEVNGNLEYPKPVNILYVDQDKCIPCVTKIFYIDNQNINIELSKISNKQKLQIDSPTNNDYNELKSELFSVYTKSNNPFEMDSLTDFSRKQEILRQYILKNPSSYAALWEIILDYTTYHEHPLYQSNLKYFSNTIKNGNLYKGFSKKLKILNSTSSGKFMPFVRIDSTNSISKSTFGQNKLTLLNYWATTCGSCIKSFPDMVKLRNEYHSQGFEVIGVSDDIVMNRMAKASNILKKNNVEWLNLFDINGEFKNKVQANVYPLYFLVDSNGKILLRKAGSFDYVQNEVKEYFKK